MSYKQDQSKLQNQHSCQHHKLHFHLNYVKFKIWNEYVNILILCSYYFFLILNICIFWFDGIFYEENGLEDSLIINNDPLFWEKIFLR